jgi:flagellar basal body-associated protein FliL
MYNFSNSKKGETLMSIIVGVAILSIAMGGVVLILAQNRTIEEDYDTNNSISILQTNAENIVRKVNTSMLAEKDVFFLKKDSVTKIFQALTGSINDGYKYIDRDGNLVTNTGSYAGSIYTRIFTVER